LRLKEQRNNGEFHRADPAKRRHMIGLLVATVVVAAGAFLALHLWLRQLIALGDPAATQRAVTHLLALMCFVLAFVGAVFALWLFRLAVATHNERRWPPTSMRTSSDVKIRYLTSADALVWQMKGGAIALALLAIAMAAWGGWLLHKG